MQFTGKDTVDVPVVQPHVLVIQKVQKTVEVAQVQCIERIVDVTVVLQRQVPTIQTAKKTVEVSADSVSSSSGRHGCGQEFKTKSEREALEVHVQKGSPDILKLVFTETAHEHPDADTTSSP